MERENINMNDKPEIEIKIFGGTNMIAPAGATAVQNFYGDQFAEVAIRPEETEGIESLNDAECLLFTYVPDVKKVHEYTRLLGECATAHDLAGVVSIMLSEPRVGQGHGGERHLHRGSSSFRFPTDIGGKGGQCETTD